MEMVAEKDIRDVFLDYLESDDRNITWFHKKVNEELKREGKNEVAYSKIYYTFKKVHNLKEEDRRIWNRVLKTNF